MIKITFDKHLYSCIALKRVLETYNDVIYTNLTQDDTNIIVEVEPKDNCYDLTNFDKEIKNRVLDEEQRMNIELETMNIRDSMFKAAMNFSINTDEA